MGHKGVIDIARKSRSNEVPNLLTSVYAFVLCKSRQKIKLIVIWGTGDT